MRLGGRHDQAHASRCRTTTLSSHRTVVAPWFEPLAGHAPGKRGSLPIWLDKQNTWPAPHEGRPWKNGFVGRTGPNRPLDSARRHGRVCRKRCTGDHARSRFEVMFRGLKASGQRITERRKISP